MTQQPIKWYRGLQANLPLFGVDGSWYFCEDTGALFSSVGTALVQVAANLSAYATQAQVAIAVAVETARAEAAESTAITNAEAFATSAVATEANARTAAIAVETGRAETAEALLQPISGKGQANGYAGLNSAGQIPSSALPALAISETYVVSSQASMLALAADVGDIAVRTDVTLSFILQSTPASTLANWVQLLFPPANVLSVFGRTGAVGAMSGDYSAFYDAAGAAATAQATAESFTTSAVATEATARNTAIAVETTRAETAEVVAISTAETFATSAVATETSRAETAEALLVPKTTTVNTHALSGNVVISASDLTTGTLPHAQLPALVSGDIPNNAANTTGTSVNLSGTPALPNGTTATTQLALDSSTKLSTTSYVDLAVGVEKTRALAAEAVVLAAIPTSFAWNVEGNASGNLSLSNAAFTSTFNQTSAVVWLWANTAVATALTTNASPVLSRAANYWTGSASAPDTWGHWKLTGSGHERRKYADDCTLWKHRVCTGKSCVSHIPHRERQPLQHLLPRPVDLRHRNGGQW
jgi:hypothetical protein